MLELGGIDGSWIGDGEVNGSLLIPPAIAQSSTRRQARLGRFARVVPQNAAESLTALDLAGDAAYFLARID